MYIYIHIYISQIPVDTCKCSMSYLSTVHYHAASCYTTACYAVLFILVHSST